MKPYRILQVFNRYLEYGGEEKIVTELPVLLNRSDAVIETCLFESAEWKQPSAPPIWRQPFLMFRNPSALDRLKQHHNQFKPDVWLVHNIFPVASTAVYELALKLKIPIIQYCHNYRPFSVGATLWDGKKVEPAGLQKNFWPEVWAGSWQKSKIKSACLAIVLRELHRRHWLRSVKTWIAPSQFVRQKFIEAGIPKESVITLHHTWQMQNSTPPASTGKNFLFLGRLDSYKGIVPLLETWNILYKNHGINGPRLHIGGKGPLQKNIETSMQTNPLISYLGLISGQAKQQAMQNCLALIIPSLCWETFGLVVYESYDYAKPVLAANSGGLADLVKPEVTGFLHTPGNALELSQQVTQLFQNPELARSMGLTAHHWLTTHVDPMQWQRDFLNIVQRSITAG